jgi:hypothetical protein
MARVLPKESLRVSVYIQNCSIRAPGAIIHKLIVSPVGLGIKNDCAGEASNDLLNLV